jgi:hypothetical protein
MVGYIGTALACFKHQIPTRPQHVPHEWQKPVYGQETQLTTPKDTLPPLSATAINRVQQITGTLLYYARAIDATMLLALGTLAEEQTRESKNTAKAVVQLLNYAISHPNATIRYISSDMLLHIDSYASYLSLPQARSRAGGLHYLSSASGDPSKAPTVTPPLNGPVHVVCNKLRHVMASAAEAEVGADAVSLRSTLADLGHPQPPTPVKTDNSAAVGIFNNTIKQHRSKAMYVHFYWICGRVEQGQFIIFWRPRTEKLGDYYTKHHSLAHHRLMRPTFLLPSSRGSIYAHGNRPASCEGVLILAAPFAPLTTQCAHNRASSTERHLYH